MRKWRRDLHEFDPKTEEEKRELSAYLERLESSVSLCTLQLNESEEDEDMSLWDLL